MWPWWLFKIIIAWLITELLKAAGKAPLALLLRWGSSACSSSSSWGFLLSCRGLRGLRQRPWFQLVVGQKLCDCSNDASAMAGLHRIRCGIYIYIYIYIYRERERERERDVAWDNSSGDMLTHALRCQSVLPPMSALSAPTQTTHYCSGIVLGPRTYDQ